MWFVVAGLMAVVIFMASRKEPDSAQTGDVPPNHLLPGTGASAVQSPATTGGNPLSASAGKVIATMTTRLPSILRGGARSMVTPPPASVDSSPVDKQLFTQGPQPQVSTINRSPVTNTFTRKL